MKKFWISIALLIGAIIGSGCNTIHGFGKDLEKVGDKVQEKSAR